MLGRFGHRRWSWHPIRARKSASGAVLRMRARPHRDARDDPVVQAARRSSKRHRVTNAAPTSCCRTGAPRLPSAAGAPADVARRARRSPADDSRKCSPRRRFRRLPHATAGTPCTGAAPHGAGTVARPLLRQFAARPWPCWVTAARPMPAHSNSCALAGAHAARRPAAAPPRPRSPSSRRQAAPSGCAGSAARRHPGPRASSAAASAARAPMRRGAGAVDRPRRPRRCDRAARPPPPGQQPGALAHRPAAQQTRCHRLSRLLRELARAHGLKLRWLRRARARNAWARAPSSQSRRGNARRDAGIAHLSYRPRRAPRQPPDVALVGKGILFDTGGTNLKPHRSMLDMHTDMSGSAVALATLVALAELQCAAGVDAWLAITENRIGPTAYRPQEVVRAVNGITIQVIHTDAEGRMVLADTLALAARTQAGAHLDFATLTGACVYALTERMSGMFANRRRAGRARARRPARAAASASGTFPCDDDYDSELESQSPMSCSAPSTARPTTSWPRASCRASCPRTCPGCTWICRPPRGAVALAHVTTDITGFGVRFTLELLLGRKAAVRWSRRCAAPHAPRRLAPASARRRRAGGGAAAYGRAVCARHRHAEPASRR